MSFKFNVSSVLPASSATSFDHGIEYPALIAGLWGASTEYQGTVRDGVLVLVLIEDNNKKYVYRSQFVSLTGYVLGQNAGYAKLMRGLLRCSDSDGELKKKIMNAGMNEITSLVGKPCLARMCVKEKEGKSWASIEALQGETPRFKGLDSEAVSGAEPVDIQRVAGRFVKVADLEDCKTVPQLRIAENAKTASDGLKDVYKDDVTDSIF